MSAGVYLNGRPYARGDYCEWRGRVRVGRSDLAGVPDVFHLGVIKDFFIVSCSRAENSVFVSISELDPYVSEKDVEQGLYIVSKEALLLETQTNTRIIHIDSIHAKVHVTSHFNPDIQHLVCGIRVWSAI